MKEAIKLAIEKGGYKYKGISGRYYVPTEERMDEYNMYSDILLSPEFWQALGRALGWPEAASQKDSWFEYAMYYFENHLINGDDETWFSNLLKEK